jgi:hypothetical protein
MVQIGRDRDKEAAVTLLLKQTIVGISSAIEAA